MIYLYYLLIAVGGALPAAVSLAFVGAVFVQQTSAFWLNRPLGQPRRAGRPSVVPTGPTPAHEVQLRRWNIAASVVVVSPAVLATLAYIVAESEIAGCVPNELYGCFLTGALTEVMLAFLFGSIVFALIYLNVLFSNGVRNAALLAYAIWALTRSLLILTPQFVDTTELAAQAVPAAVGVLAFVAAVSLPHGRLKTVAIGASCAILTIPLVSVTMSNSVLLLTDGLLSATAIGYGVYLIHRRKGGAHGASVAHIATSVVLLAAMVLAVTRLAVFTEPDESTTSEEVSRAGAYMSWAIFGLISSLLTLIITLSHRLTELRPFLLGLTWPALMLLAAGPDRLGTAELGWPERLIGAAMTVALLWAMWYIFGPGSRAATKIEPKEHGVT